MSLNSSDTNASVEAFDLASDFYLALKDAARWTTPGAWYSRWVYRGQRDADWPLLPSAWRKPSTPALARLLEVKTRILEGNREAIVAELSAVGRDKDYNPDWLLDAYAHARAEFRLALEFVEMADRLGHPVPGMQRYVSLRDYNWFPELRNLSHFRFVIEPSSATALAQHHGIPTRYLDWTRSATKAAFFAASEVTDAEGSGRIAVWATRPDILMSKGQVAVDSDDARRFLVYEVPQSENAYLRAQDGLFLVPAAGCMHFVKHGCWPSFEGFAQATQQAANEPVLKKLTLPVAEVGELLRLLWLDGVSKAHLMPTYDNITAALLTKWRWHQ